MIFGMELGHHVGVVERSPPDHRAAELHRFEIGDRSHCAGASDLIVDPKQPGTRLFGLELERHSPSRELGGIAVRPLAVELVDFYDYSVGRERKDLALHVPVVDICTDF